MAKITTWIEDNTYQLYQHFMKSQPTPHQIARIHSLYNFGNPYKKKRQANEEITMKMFQTALIRYVEMKMLKHRHKERCLAHNEIQWKLVYSPTYIQKLHYFDF